MFNLHQDTSQTLYSIDSSRSTLDTILGITELSRIVQGFLFNTTQGTRLWLISRQLSKRVKETVDDVGIEVLSLQYQLPITSCRASAKIKGIVSNFRHCLSWSRSASEVVTGFEWLTSYQEKLRCVKKVNVKFSFGVHDYISCTIDNRHCRNNEGSCLFEFNPIVVRQANNRNPEVFQHISDTLSGRYGSVRDIKRSVRIGSHSGRQNMLVFDIPSKSCGVTSHWYESIRTLDIRHGTVSDLSGLGSCTALHTLNLWGCKGVIDLSALGNCASLHTLNLSRCDQVRDLSGIENCASLHTLDLWNTDVVDVSALGRCASLHTLDLKRTKIKDVSALGNCASLHTLDISWTKVSDVSALGNCASLHTLDLSWTKVSDVSALAECSSLYALILQGTQVSQISALGKCSSLYMLYVGYTRISDMSALMICRKFRKVYVSDILVTDDGGPKVVIR